MSGGHGPAVMGIANVTPDSFSGGGVHFDRGVAIEARMAGSLAPVAAAVRGCAAVVRVHDVRETADFLKVLDAIEAHA